MLPTTSNTKDVLAAEAVALNSTLKDGSSLTSGSALGTVEEKFEREEIAPICCSNCCMPCSRAFMPFLLLLGVIESVVVTISYSYLFTPTILTGLLAIGSWVWSTVEMQQKRASRYSFPLYVFASTLNLFGLLSAKVMTWIYFLAIAEPTNTSNFDASAHLLWSVFLVVIPLIYLFVAPVDLLFTALFIRRTRRNQSCRNPASFISSTLDRFSI